MIKILLTGKSGQVGFELQKQLVKIGNVMAIGRDDFDFLNREELLSIVNRYKPDLIVNAAAYTNVAAAETEPELAWAINVELLETLCQSAALNNSLIVHYSSDYVFDGTKDGFYDEADKTNPLNVYGISKAAGEKLLMDSGVSGLLLRTSWVVSSRRKNFLRTISNIGMNNVEAEVVCDQVGTPTTAKFIAKITRLLLEKSIVENSFLIKEMLMFNVVPNGVASWYDISYFTISKLAQMGVELNLKPTSIKPIKTLDYNSNVKRPLNSRLSNDKLKKWLSVSLPNWKLGVEEVLSEISVALKG